VRPYIFRPAAASDIRRARLWYERQRRGLGDEFLAEVRVAMDAALTMPEAYPILHRQTRRAMVRRFPYGLFYRLVDTVVVFVACMDTRRSSEGWKRRR
jgi:plasmid stabilization system protein ParE